jgi:hypothetical protein
VGEGITRGMKRVKQVGYVSKGDQLNTQGTEQLLENSERNSMKTKGKLNCGGSSGAFSSVHVTTKLCVRLASKPPNNYTTFLGEL